METTITLSPDDQEQVGRPVQVAVHVTDLGVSVSILEESSPVAVADVLVEHYAAQVRALVWTEHDLPAYGEDPREIVLVADTTAPLRVPEPEEVAYG